MRTGRAPVRSRPCVAALGALLATACGSTEPDPVPTPCPPARSAYAQSVVESWIPACSLAQNRYNNPLEAIGAPNAAGSGAAGYTGFVSLGFGGHVTLDLGGCVADQAGNDIRVWQAVSSEPVSIYVSTSPTGPFTLVLPVLQACGIRYAGVRGYCEFDLASAAVREARYIRVEDGELYPCPGDTDTEGADLDAVQALAIPAPSPLALAASGATAP